MPTIQSVSPAELLSNTVRVTLDCGHDILVSSSDPTLEPGMGMVCEPCLRHERRILSIHRSNTSRGLARAEVDIELECHHAVSNIPLPNDITLDMAQEFIGTSRRCLTCYPDTAERRINP